MDLKHSSMRNSKFYEIIKSISKEDNRIKGLGYYPTFVHVDIRESTKLITWNGNRLSNEISESNV